MARKTTSKSKKDADPIETDTSSDVEEQVTEPGEPEDAIEAVAEDVTSQAA